MAKKPTSPLEIICVIVARGNNEKVAKVLTENKVEFQVNCLGEGTSKSNVQSIFGFALTERDIVFGLVKPHKIKPIFEGLENSLIDENGEGLCIAFTLPLSSATSTTLDALGIKY